MDEREGERVWKIHVSRRKIFSQFACQNTKNEEEGQPTGMRVTKKEVHVAREQEGGKKKRREFIRKSASNIDVKNCSVTLSCVVAIHLDTVRQTNFNARLKARKCGVVKSTSVFVWTRTRVDLLERG